MFSKNIVKKNPKKRQNKNMGAKVSTPNQNFVEVFIKKYL